MVCAEQFSGLMPVLQVIFNRHSRVTAITASFPLHHQQLSHKWLLLHSHGIWMPPSSGIPKISLALAFLYLPTLVQRKGLSVFPLLNKALSVQILCTSFLIVLPVYNVSQTFPI